MHSGSPVNLPQSITEKLFGVAVVRPVLSRTSLTPREEVSAEQAVEIYEDHSIHCHQAGQKVSTVIQPGVIVDEVPGEEELGSETESYVCEEVEEFVDLVHGGGLSARQLQQQPQVQGDAVDLYKESYYSAGYKQLSKEGVQEDPDHLRGRNRWRCLTAD